MSATKLVLAASTEHLSTGEGIAFAAVILVFGVMLILWMRGDI